MLSTDKDRCRIRTAALVARKGGSGKSTLAVALAVQHERAGGRAVVVDLDPQGNATAWGALREADRPVVVAAQARRLQPVLDAARDGGADLTIIDTPPALADAALAAARGELTCKADPPRVPRDSTVDASGAGRGGEAARNGLTVEAPEHWRLIVAPVARPKRPHCARRAVLEVANSLTHNRINVGSDHSHSGVQSGGAQTGPSS